MKFEPKSFSCCSVRPVPESPSCSTGTLDALNRDWTTAYWSQTYNRWDEIPLPAAGGNPGLLLEHRGREAEAEEQYRLALRIFPDDVKAHVNLGNALVRHGKPSEAVQQYEEALWIQPNHAQARINLGNVWLLQGNISEAIGDYEEALRIDPHSVEAHLNLGVALEQAGRASEAIEQYEQVLRLNPDLTAASNALARLRPGQ